MMGEDRKRLVKRDVSEPQWSNRRDCGWSVTSQQNRECEVEAAGSTIAARSHHASRAFSVRLPSCALRLPEHFRSFPPVPYQDISDMLLFSLTEAGDGRKAPEMFGKTQRTGGETNGKGS